MRGFNTVLSREERDKITNLGRTFIRSAAPTVNDDENSVETDVPDGYRRFDRWFDDRAAGAGGIEMFTCLDPSAGAAKWDQKTLDKDDLDALFAVKADQDAGEY